MKEALTIILAILGLAVLVAGIYIRHGKDRRGLVDLDSYYWGEGQNEEAGE